jgi:hypothetical protein
LPAEALARRREAIVDEEPLRPRRAQQARRVFGLLGLYPVPKDGGLVRRELEELGQLADRTAVGEPRRDVRPLPRVGALGEEPAELVEARRGLAQDSVRVVVDETDAGQYFKKWPCCSNNSSPAE